MRRSIFKILLSMTAAIAIVNASAEDLPNGNRANHKSISSGSTKAKGSNLSELIAMLMKTGDDDTTGTISRQLGLTGDLPIKGRDFTLPRPGGKERRECSIVFSSEAPTSTSTERHATCIYIQHKFSSAPGFDATYYRMSLDGKLEYAVVSHGKYDPDGQVVPGSAVDEMKDIDSPEVQKAFKAELAYWTREWVKAEKKAEARKTEKSSESSAK